MPSQPQDAERLARELDWNLLRTFVTLAESGSVTEAAERLRLKQPTVSNALRRLEDRLGKRLIDRSPGHYRLTEAGKALHREAVEINGSIRRLGTLMRDITDDVRGHVTVAMASHVVCPLLDDALASFHAQYPAATLSLEVSRSRDALDAVLARRASFAICLVRERSPRLSYSRLYREFFGLFCGPTHPLFGRTGLSIDALRGSASVSFVTDQMGDALRPVALMRAEAGLDDRIVGSSANLEEVRRLIVAGVGIGPLPLHAVRRDVEDGLLWRLPPYENPPPIDVHAVWNPRSRMNRAERALLQMIRDAIAATHISERTYQ